MPAFPVAPRVRACLLACLALAAPTAAWAQTYSDNTAVPIADVACFTRTITVPVALVVADLNVQVDITHTYRGDLDITLTSPLGTAINLTSDNGGTANNLRVLFDDAAATPIVGDTTNHAAIVQRRPEAVLSAVNGQNAAGLWSMQVCDDEAVDVGTLTGWSLVFTAASANVAMTKTNTPGVNGEVDQGADTVVSGTATTYTITVTNLGPDAADGAVITDPVPTNLTCGTATCAAAGGAACPVPTGAALVAALQGAGAAVPTLPNGGSVAITLNCTVN